MKIVKVVQPKGIFDGTKAFEFRQEIDRIIERTVDILLVDFQDITFMDSSGLGALVLALKAVKAATGEMYICSINEQIRMLFELTSMDRVFEIYPSREDFENAISSSL